MTDTCYECTRSDHPLCAEHEAIRLGAFPAVACAKYLSRHYWQYEDSPLPCSPDCCINQKTYDQTVNWYRICLALDGPMWYPNGKLYCGPDSDGLWKTLIDIYKLWPCEPCDCTEEDLENYVPREQLGFVLL